MLVKLILPALTEATSPLFRPIKYSLFPPLGLATLAAYLGPQDRALIIDEHVERLRLDDAPDLVVIQVYITSARRSYEIADSYRRRGVFVALGGLHVTSLPEEAAEHADAVFIGPGEDIWPRFLNDYRAGRASRRYESRERTLKGVPPIRRDLIKRHLYLVPNSIVVSRGCPHACDFCYKEAFFQGGRSFYTQTVDDALAEIERLPGRHLYFLDDHLFGNRRFAAALFEGMKGMGRVWQAAGTLNSILENRIEPHLLEKAAACGLRSLFVGFESINTASLKEQHKHQNLNRDYRQAIARLHGLGIMVNGSFVFGMDEDGPGVFEQTVEWAVRQGIETATFHILTPYPGTALYARMEAQDRLIHRDWDLYDTRHTVFRPAKMTPQQLEEGYWRAYHDFYRWPSILKGAMTKASWAGRLRHFAYAAGWKKFEPLWDFVIRAKRVAQMRPLLEAVLCREPPRDELRDQKDQEKGNKDKDVRVTAAQCMDLETRSTSDISLKVFLP
ncbi:MAG: B12-binding domain-containing radical SAM protein [Acidobacteriia bacterium]|nr:B12-binding domain-containing radical SAM protein [Terriglobia bacterium]